MNRVVLVVCDGLRRDLVNACDAPTLARLRDEGAYFSDFRSVFPSTTRTCAASIATGCLPVSHGLLGNTMVLDEGNGLACVSAGKPDFLDRLRRATGRALGRATMHERVAVQGVAVAMSNVSPGAAYVHDPQGAGFVYHRNGSFGPGKRPLADGLAIRVGAEGDRIMTGRFCDEVTGRHDAPYAVLWLSEPDHTGHHAPLGSPQHRAAIAEADCNVARVLATIDRLDPVGDQILFAVCSDHGMQTIRRRVDIASRLVAAGFKASDASTDVVIAPQGTSALLHVSEAARSRIAPLACWLAQQDFISWVAVGDDLPALGLPAGGTLAIALGLANDDEPNAHGVRGRSDVAVNPLGGGALPGHGQHGGLATYEQRPFLALRGGGFIRGVHEDPASPIDLAPTMLRHLGLEAGAVDGRALPRAT